MAKLLLADIMDTHASRVETAEDASKNVGTVLSCSRLSKVFASGGNRLVVFSGLSIAIQSGEMVAIVGESGTGKSTLLHILSGLDRPSEGDVYFAARLISQMSEDELADFRNREIGFVWQFHYLLPEFTALENVMMPLLIGGRNEREATTEAGARLTEVGLGQRAGHRSGELSGGEQQRVAIARALVTRPALLMADEPTGNLDEVTGSMIFDLLQRLHHQHGLTSLIVTHNETFARRCDRLLRLSGGVLQEQTKGSSAWVEPEARSDA